MLPLPIFIQKNKNQQRPTNLIKTIHLRFLEHVVDFLKNGVAHRQSVLEIFDLIGARKIVRVR